VIHELLRGIDFGHVAVASGAIHFRMKMGSVVEADERMRLEFIDTLPWDLNPFRGVVGNFFDFRFVCRGHGMTEHTFADRRDGSGWTNIRHTVAIEALKPEREMFSVGIGDRLLGKKRGNKNQSE